MSDEDAYDDGYYDEEIEYGDEDEFSAAKMMNANVDGHLESSDAVMDSQMEQQMVEQMMMEKYRQGVLTTEGEKVENDDQEEDEEQEIDDSDDYDVEPAI